MIDIDIYSPDLEDYQVVALKMQLQKTLHDYLPYPLSATISIKITELDDVE